MIRALIIWMVRRSHPIHGRHPVTIVRWPADVDPERRFTNERMLVVVARRYMPFFRDEIQRVDNTIYRPHPCWAPFSALLHHWRAHEDSTFHDHQRWSVTIVLKGELTELTPWGEKPLPAGSIVLRSTRCIHGFRVHPEHSARTWTLFIVGRRRGVQNTYGVTKRFDAPVRRLPAA